MSESGFLSERRQVTSRRWDCRPQWARLEPAWCKGVGRPLDKDVVSFTTAILPTPTSPPPFLLLIHNEACASPCPALPTVPGGDPRLLQPVLPHPSLPVGRGGRLDGCQWSKTALPGGLGGVCTRRPGSLEAVEGRGPSGPGSSQDPPTSWDVVTFTLPGAAGLPSIHGFWRRAAAVPTLRALPSFSVCRHPMASALRISKPLCSSPWRNGGCSSRTPSLADHSGCCSKNMRWREGPSLLRFRMSAHHVIFFSFSPVLGGDQ